MSLKVIVPEVGESITEVTIAGWLKQDGDHVKMDEVICELESEKATFELPAEAEGKLRIIANEGDTLVIGAEICEIDTDAVVAAVTSEDAPPVAGASTPSSKTGKTIEMRVPEVGESITEVTMSSWIKEEGAYVELDEIIAEIDSEKATFELPAEATGILQHVAKEDQVLKIGDLICKIEEYMATENASSQTEPAPISSEVDQGNDGYAKGENNCRCKYRRRNNCSITTG
jgi:2-oxoglutarate dehydrogenase E2 component (dihydrolipoamide succinyltransferase)